MTNDRTIKLSAFVTAGPGRAGGWRHPLSEPGWLSAAYYQNIGKILEDGLFDLAFFADIVAVPSRYQNSIAGQVQYGALGSLRLDPLLVLTSIAAATEHLGLGATVSTTYAQPFHAARSFATLDHLSQGRAAWNVVTSFQEAEARNFSQIELLDKASRYQRADEFLEVAAKLWDSWDDDALVIDPAAPVFADPDKVHRIDHHGRWFDIDGPLNVSRPPQGYPVILQAGASGSGKDLAARWADAIFCSHASLESAQEFYADIKERAKAAGRNPDDVKILPSITPIVRPTEAEAQETANELLELVHEDAGLSQLSYHLDIDLSQFNLDEPLPALDDPSIAGHYHEVAEITRREGISLRKLGQQYGGRTEGNFIGTPTQIADGLEEWFTKGAADGFTVGAVYQPGAFAEFVRDVVPELQSRGLYRTSYEGTTLRDRLGVARPAQGDWKLRAGRAE